MNERLNHLTWDEYYMALAKMTAIRSKDPNSQVGAVIVDENNKLLSIGYNGAPIGFNDKDFPWKREGGTLETKYAFVCHAEMNAISNFRGIKKDLENAKVYVTLFPCNECAKLIIQNGIKEVIYSCDKYANTDGIKASKMMFDICNVKYRQLELDKDIIIPSNNAAYYSSDKVLKMKKRDK